MELQKDFGLVDSTEGEEDEELEQEKIAHQVEEGISLRHYKESYLLQAKLSRRRHELVSTLWVLLAIAI